MNDDRRNKKSVESIILTIIMSVFIIFSIYYFSALLILLPIPFIIFGIKNDLISSILSMVTSLLIVGLIVDPVTSLLCILVFGPFTIVNIYLIKKRTKAYRVVVYSSTVFFVSILALYGLLSIAGFDLIPQLEAQFSQTLSTYMDLFEEMGLTTYERLERRDLIQSGYNSFLIMIPAMMFISSLIISYISYLLTTWGLRKIEINIINMPRFSRLRLPDNFAIGSLIMIVTAFIISMLNLDQGDVIYINIMILLSIVLFIQGMSVINHLLIKIKMKKFIRILTYLIIFFTPAIFRAVSILGVIDVIFDLRKIKKAKSV